MDKLIIPNYHAILIHFPLGLLGLGIAIELFSFLGWRRSAFRQGGRWMILLGTLALVPAMTSGLYALRDVVGHGQEAESWAAYTSGSGFSNFDWNLVRYHIILNSAATGAALFAVVIWLGASDRWRKILHIPVLLLLLGAMGLMIDGAWHGGEMVYRQGFGVRGVKSVLPDEAMAAPAEAQDWEDKLEFYAPPGEMHMIFAGLVFAVAAVALGLSIRRSIISEDVLIERVPVTVVRGSREDDRRPISLLQALNDPGDEIPVVPRVPSARFWLLAGLLAVAAIASGLWFGDFFVKPPQIIDMERLRQSLRNVMVTSHRREGLHIVFGAAILALVLVVGILARFAPRSRVFLSATSFLLVLIMVAQVWMGILMLYDGDDGSLSHFRRAAAMAPAPAPAPTVSVPVPVTPAPTIPVPMAPAHATTGPTGG